LIDEIKRCEPTAKRTLFSAVQNVAVGQERHLLRRSDLVAIGCKADIARPSQFGRL
jgi:hypothetical protein